MKYDAELKRILDTYAQNAAEREELCEIALAIVRQNCSVACLVPPQYTEIDVTYDQAELERIFLGLSPEHQKMFMLYLCLLARQDSEHSEQDHLFEQERGSS